MNVEVVARNEDGSGAAMVLHNPPTAEDIARLTDLAAFPGLREATWTAERAQRG